MIRHILKDGTEVPDVEGKVIKADDFKTMYEVIIRITMKEESDEAVWTSN